MTATKTTTKGAKAKKATGADPEEARQAVELPVEAVLALPAYQMRAKLLEGTVREYARVLANDGAFPPIQVAKVGAQLLVVDGFHRLEAHRQAGRGTVAAVITETTAQGALRMAARANRDHPVPLTPKDRRRAFKAFITGRGHYHPETGQLLSYRDIARELGGTRGHTTIRNWMRKDFPKVYAKMGPGERLDQLPLQEPEPAPDPQEAALAQALAGLREAAKVAAGITDPKLRGRLVQEAEEMLETVKNAAPWDPYTPAF